MKRIYLDHASLSPIDKIVMKEMKEYSYQKFSNPSSLYKTGVMAKEAIESARTRIAGHIQGHADEIIFTGSGTEANNLAIFGVFENCISSGKKYEDLHGITSVIEHSSVLECFRRLEKRGVKADYISVDSKGIVNLKELKEKINSRTVLISIMAVNNEIGTIQPLREIAKLIRHVRSERGAHNENEHSENGHGHPEKTFPIFHTDACQAPLYLEINCQSLGADIITFDWQKMYGPRGIGFLWKKRSIDLEPIILGGGQEYGLRSGTENLPSIMGLAKAFDLAVSRRSADVKSVTALRDYFIEKIKLNWPDAVINGDLKDRIANNVNVSFKGIDSEFLIFQLDERGIACSAKSSCLRDEEESYVIKALGGNGEIAKNSIRFSLGREVTKKDINRVLDSLKDLM